MRQAPLKPFKTREESELENSLLLLRGASLVKGRFELRHGIFWPERDESYLPPVLGGRP